MKTVDRVWIFLRQVRRFISFTTILFVSAAYVAVTVRWQSARSRDHYRARHQTIACRRALMAIGVAVQVRGKSSVISGSLIVSNHLGILDPFVIASVFPVVFSGKAEMLDWPVVGWICRAIGLIPVHRDKRFRTLAFADTVAKRLKIGLNVLAFPEGTTTRGTDVLPFKTGAFAAVEYLDGGNVLPITLRITEVSGAQPDSASHDVFTWSDSSQSLASHFWHILEVRSATIEILVAPPLPTADRSRKELAESAYQVVRDTSVNGKFEPAPSLDAPGHG